MENKKNVVALSDDALDGVAGGMIVNSDHIINQKTGERHELLVPKEVAFNYLMQLGALSEAARVDALRAANMIP